MWCINDVCRVRNRTFVIKILHTGVPVFNIKIYNVNDNDNNNICIMVNECALFLFDTRQWCGISTVLDGLKYRLGHELQYNRSFNYMHLLS